MALSRLVYSAIDPRSVEDNCVRTVDPAYLIEEDGKVVVPSCRVLSGGRLATVLQDIEAKVPNYFCRRRQRYEL